MARSNSLANCEISSPSSPRRASEVAPLILVRGELWRLVVWIGDGLGCERGKGGDPAGFLVSDGDGDERVEVRDECGDCGCEDEDGGLSPVEEIPLSGGDVMTDASTLAISRILGYSLLHTEGPSEKLGARTESDPEVDAEENKPRGTLRLCADPSGCSGFFGAKPSPLSVCSLDRMLGVDSGGAFVASDASNGGEVIAVVNAAVEGANETDFTESKPLSTREV